MSKEELTRTQALFKLVCDEVEELQRRMRGADFTTQDMERLEYLQPIVLQYRKKMGLLEARVQASEEGSQQAKGVTTKRRTDDQGTREKGAKHRTLAASPKGSGVEEKQMKFDSIVDMFNKSVEEVSSSVPSSAGRTTPSIPATFQASVSSLPTEQQAMEQSGIPAQQTVLLPSDPRLAKLASDIRSKFEKKRQSVPPPKSGEKTTVSTPSSLEGMD